MTLCRLCGSDDLIPYRTHPPHGDSGPTRCQLACPQDGLFCRRCRYFRPTEAIACRSLNAGKG